MLNFLTSSRIVIICILPILFIMPGCGGGGSDGDGGGGTPAPTVPTVLNYSVGTSTMTPLLTGTAAGGAITFNVTAISLIGTYDRNSGATTLSENKGMAFTMNPGPLGGTLTAAIYTAPGSTGKWTSGQDPTEGRLSVDAGSGLIVIQVNNSLPGVDISKGLDSMSLAWSDFKNAQENAARPDFVRIASAAYNALQTVYRCISVAYTMIEVVMANQDTLVHSMISVPTTELPGYTPAGMSAQLEDNDHNGDINPGDGFMSRFSNWWVDNPGTNQDYFYHGRLLWLDYWEGTNSSGTFVGGDFKFGITGDEFFEEEVNSGAPDPGTRIKYNESGFFFLLSW